MSEEKGFTTQEKENVRLFIISVFFALLGMVTLVASTLGFAIWAGKHLGL